MIDSCHFSCQCSARDRRGSKPVRQSQIVQNALYGFDTVVTQVPAPPGILFLGRQRGLFPLQKMSRQELDKTVCMFMSELSFKDNLQLLFGKTALKFIVVFNAGFRSFQIYLYNAFHANIYNLILKFSSPRYAT